MSSNRLRSPRTTTFPQVRLPAAVVHRERQPSLVARTAAHPAAMTPVTVLPRPRRPRLGLACLGAAVCLTVATVPSPASSEPGGWQWPLDPQPPLARGFEPPSHPWGPGHRGVDLAARPGQPVRAVAVGRVSFAGQVAGTGVVVVSHGRLRSTYQPLLPAVHGGDRVVAGAIVGHIVTVGSHCLPSACLHLGAREGDRYVDPLSLLEHRPIRLKPLQGLPTPRAQVPYAGPPSLLRLVPPSALGAWMGLAVGSP